MAKRRQCYQIPGYSSGGGALRNFAPVGTRIDDFLFSSPIIGSDPGAGQIGHGPEEQAELALRNACTLLNTAGYSPDDVVRVYFWVQDHAIKHAVIKPWLEIFPSAASRPAANFVAKTDLPGGTLLQVEIVAVRGGSARRSVFIPGTEESPFPSGAVKGGLLCTSTLSPRYPRTGRIPETPEGQADVLLQNLQAVLESADCHKDSVAHTLHWCQNLSYRAVLSDPFVRMFPTFGDRPARHGVARLMPAGIMMEYEGMAEIGCRRKALFIGGVAHAGIKHVWNALPMGAIGGKLVYSAGTHGLNIRTQRCGSGPEQAEWSFIHQSTLLREAGLSWDDVVHLVTWYRGAENKDLVNEQWLKHFPNEDDRPAHHLIESQLPGGAAGGESPGQRTSSDERLPPILIQTEFIAVAR